MKRGVCGDFGTPLGLVPNLLIVPPSLEAAANKIVKNAPFIVTFQIRKDAVVGAASPLSKGETELVTVNDLGALGAILGGFALPFVWVTPTLPDPHPVETTRP